MLSKLGLIIFLGRNNLLARLTNSFSGCGVSLTDFKTDEALYVKNFGLLTESIN